MTYIIKNAKVILLDRITDDEILIINDKIAEIGNITDVPEDAIIIDAGGKYVAPGFVDIHVHGGVGCSATEGKDNVLKVVKAHAQYGTTTIVPSLYSVPIPQTIEGARGIVEAMESGDAPITIAGIHFEGPFLAPAQAGAQKADLLVAPENVELSQFDEFLPYTKIFAMAPELPGALEFARKLSDMGICVSIAHSDANYDLVEKAIEHGFSDVTHLYSACSMVHRENAFRIAGIVEAGLEKDELTCQAIADGCHLPDAILRLIYKCKGAERMYLVTDGTECAACDVAEGTIVKQSSGIEIVIEDGVAKLLSRQAFAGSIATTDRLVHTAVKAGIPLVDAVRMMSDTPARRINMPNKGKIAENMDADIVMFDENINVSMVMAMGKIIRNK